MIKRILTALDPDPDTPVAIRYAVEIATRYDAEVTGLALVDTRHIALEVGGGGIGSMYYAESLRERQTGKARNTARELTDAFEETLKKANIRHGEWVEDGVPFKRIMEESRYHDLLILGHASHFAYSDPKHLTHTLPKVVKRGVAPTFVVGKQYRPIKRVVLAFDGSDPSARTMQRFAQFQPFGHEISLEVVNIRSSESDRGRRDSELLLRLAGAFLRAHGYDHVQETSLEWGNPAERLLGHARQIEADLIVAGAHSVSAVRRIAFGSTTHALLEKCDIPVFLFH